MRVMIPVDDMPYTFAALISVTLRTWPDGTTFVLARVVEDSHAYGQAAQLEDFRHEQKLEGEMVLSVQKTQKWIERLADAVKIQGCETQTAIVKGTNVAEELASLTNRHDIDYIVIGSHERKPSERAWLGSVASSLTERVNCSIEIVRPKGLHKLLLIERFDFDEIEQMCYAPKHILVATDFSENSLAALDCLERMGCSPGTKLSLITVIPPQASDTINSQLSNPLLKEGYLKRAVKERARQLEEQMGATTYATIVAKGDPAAEIIACARTNEPDMIVMGAHGQDRSIDQTMGSITRAVVDGSPCSVVIVNSRKPLPACFSWNAPLP